MRGLSRTKGDEEWLKEVGKRLETLIRKKGYKSPYDFWVNRAGDHISRASLNFILAGKTDPKATTLRILARLLEIRVSKILEADG